MLSTKLLQLVIFNNFCYNMVFRRQKNLKAIVYCIALNDNYEHGSIDSIIVTYKSGIHIVLLNANNF